MKELLQKGREIWAVKDFPFPELSSGWERCSEIYANEKETLPKTRQLILTTI